MKKFDDNVMKLINFFYHRPFAIKLIRLLFAVVVFGSSKFGKLPIGLQILFAISFIGHAISDYLDGFYFGIDWNEGDLDDESKRE